MSDSSRPPTGRRTWLDPTWLAEARTWVETILTRSGRAITGPLDQPHVRPWSTAIRIPTTAGPVWFKASGPGPSHEGPLLDVFRRHDVGHVLLPIATHATRPWLLFEDGGPTLRATRADGTGDHDLLAWERILQTYAAVQRSLEGDGVVAAMLDASTPDGRPQELAAALHRLVADDRVWALVPDAERAAGAAARTRLSTAVTGSEIAELVDALEAVGIRPSIQHDDLHGGNILVGPRGDRFFDWGDAVVAHPYSTLTTTFNSIAHHTSRSIDDAAFVRLRDVYTEAWSDVASPSAQRAAARLARGLGCVGKALAWERALQDLEPDEMDGHGEAVSGWLMEFADWLEVDPSGWVNR